MMFEDGGRYHPKHNPVRVALAFLREMSAADRLRVLDELKEYSGLRDALYEIARARGDLCEQTPYWAKDALLENGEEVP
jgi:hypothetical protein